MRHARIALIAAMAMAATPAFAADEANVIIAGAYLQMVIPERPAAGYFIIKNSGAADVVLVGASSPGCGTLMLHLSMNDSGTDRMVAVDTATIPAHGTVVFAPTGFHLMCMAPTEAVTPGGTVPVTLTFADGGTLTADFPVRSPTE